MQNVQNAIKQKDSSSMLCSLCCLLIACYLIVGYAGKIHKKFVLLAHPDSSLAVAVIEGHRFSYIYRKTLQKQGSGESQVHLTEAVESCAL